MEILTLVILMNVFVLFLIVSYAMKKNFEFIDKQLQVIEIKLVSSEKCSRSMHGATHDLLLGIHRKLDDRQNIESECSTSAENKL